MDENSHDLHEPCDSLKSEHKDNRSPPCDPSQHVRHRTPRHGTEPAAEARRGSPAWVSGVPALVQGVSLKVVLNIYKEGPS